MIKDLLLGSSLKIIDSVGKLIDSTFTSDEEKLKFKVDLKILKAKSKLESENIALKYDQEVTKRWISDNESVITRLVRPISFISVLFLFFIIVIADGNVGRFTVNTAYIPVIQGLLSVMVVSYFGSRGFEKIARIWKTSK